MTEDRWSAWIGRERSGGDGGREASIRAAARTMADRVLRRLPLAPGDAVIDLGCGDGVVGLAALERPGVHVTFVDISPTLLEHVRETVRERDALDRAAFLAVDAVSLEGIPDRSMEAVFARASLTYVPDKVKAFAAAYRVLRPRGVLSIAEPMLRDAALRLVATRESLPTADPDVELLHRWNARALPDTLADIRADSRTNFDALSLFQYAVFAGFTDVHARLHLDSLPSDAMPWEVALATALLPGTPTLGAALLEHYSADERIRFERRFRPLFEQGGFPADIAAMIYVWAVRPVT